MATKHSAARPQVCCLIAVVLNFGLLVTSCSLDEPDVPLHQRAQQTQEVSILRSPSSSLLAPTSELSRELENSEIEFHNVELIGEPVTFAITHTIARSSVIVDVVVESVGDPEYSTIDGTLRPEAIPSRDPRFKSLPVSPPMIFRPVYVAVRKYLKILPGNEFDGYVILARGGSLSYDYHVTPAFPLDQAGKSGILFTNEPDLSNKTGMTPLLLTACRLSHLASVKSSDGRRYGVLVDGIEYIQHDGKYSSVNGYQSLTLDDIEAAVLRLAQLRQPGP